MLYNWAIYAMSVGVRIAALFNDKVSRMYRGQKECFRRLQEAIGPDDRYIWFHAASLGEFEQGRPLIEEIRRRHPEYKILQTFFSPSGYEVRKDYKGADIVCYLPLDTPGNARRFVELVRPIQAYFIKYEFWKNYLDELSRRSIPVYSVSSIFRPKQIFFKWYGSDYRRVLNDFTHLFVQNEESRQLLAKIGVHSVSVVGDTRMDRVLDIREAAKELPLISEFKKDALCFIAGSSWGADEQIFMEYLNRHPEIKVVIAPHVVDDAHLKNLENMAQGQAIRYSEATLEHVHQARYLLIDGYGLLSSIYRYADVAYIGGGFGVGIHNVPEAAVYGIPVIFGPNHKRFREAVDLIHVGGGFCINSTKDFEALMDRLLSDVNYRQRAGEKAGHYVSSNSGALQKILSVTDAQI